MNEMTGYHKKAPVCCLRQVNSRIGLGEPPGETLPRATACGTARDLQA
jgi:hypothetical protein